MSTSNDNGRHAYDEAQDALSDAYQAAREVGYAPGSEQMTRLAQAEARCKETPNPNAQTEPAPPTPAGTDS
jgi:hypothetical protein